MFRRGGRVRSRLNRRRIPALAQLIIVCCPCLVVAQTMYWSSSFGPIGLGNISTRSGTLEGSSQAQLEMTGDVEISADNSTTARLSGPGGDTLVTEYKLAFDGDGSSATGAATVDYTSYDSFLSPAVSVTHVGADDAVVVTLHVRAANYPGDLANSGAYSATQTLTASWVGP